MSIVNDFFEGVTGVLGGILDKATAVVDPIMESPTAPLTLFAMGSGFFPGDAAFAAGADPSALASIAAEEAALASAPHAFGAGEAFASGALTPAASPLMPPADLSGVQLAQIAQSSDPIEAIIKLSDIGGGSALAGANALGFDSVEQALAAVNPGWAIVTGVEAFAPTMPPAKLPGLGPSTQSPALGSATATAAAQNLQTSAFLEEIKKMLNNPWLRAANTASGILGLMKASELSKLAQRAASQQDPFGPYRAGYAEDLRRLMTNPADVTKLPGYEAGIEAVNRGLAKAGYLGSGNQMAALQQYGGAFYDQAAQRLAQLAGAQFPPSGGEALLRGGALQTDLMSRALASLAMGRPWEYLGFGR
jgi:hypothetical protein